MLSPLPVPAGDAVLGLLPVLARALAGEGDALLPHAADGAPAAQLRPGTPLDDGEDDPHDPTAVVVATSGSTGTAKGALLGAAALRASAAATAQRLLPGPGGVDGDGGAAAQQWVLALPAQHVAGLQVLLRSVRAGTEPVVVDLSRGFTPAAFVAAAAACTAPHRLVSLVPTQLVRLLDAGPEPTAALAGFTAVLVGAAATPPALLARARAAGVAVRTTYGSSETCGGCVYDGVPLDGVEAALDGGRLVLAGDVVARGYRGRPGDAAFGTTATGRRRFRTDDAAVLDAAGRVHVTGRMDDLITTGGLKVAPGLVEAALAEHPDVAEAVVVGVPDEEWGERVVACVVPAAGRAAPGLAELRSLVGARVSAAAAPRQLVLLDRLPLRGPGKPDRRRLREVAAAGTAGAPRSSSG
nr:o-succinylbenzoate--CoA ligase [Kineococcus siccus]